MSVFSIIWVTAVALATAALSALLNGWALTKLWAWFCMPAFGAPALSIAVACGIALIVHAVTWQDDTEYAKKSDDRSAGEKLAVQAVFAIIRPLAILLVGLIYKQFI